MAKAVKKRPPRGLSLLKSLEADMYWSIRNESAQALGIRIAFWDGASRMYKTLKHKKVKDG
jgi:hypothetical protein